MAAYNEALCHAPVDSGIVALIVANRSQVLYELGHHNLALLNIELAHDSGYPPHLLYKLAAREAVCYSALGMREKSRRGFERAKESLGKLIEDNDSRRSFIRLKEKEGKKISENFEVRISEKKINTKYRTSASQVPGLHFKS